MPEHPFVEVFLALGTNLGDRQQNLALALQKINGFVNIKKRSHVYETPPWGVLDQPNFFNQVIKGNTNQTPFELLKSLKQVEISMGRVPSERFGPRLIDVDILLYDSQEIETPGLTIPHPRMLERAFVLVPLAEIAPDVVIPGTSSTVSEALLRIDPKGIKKLSNNIFKDNE